MFSANQSAQKEASSAPTCAAKYHGTTRSFLCMGGVGEQNRDRPTKAISWWDGGEILGGRYEVGGGTWLACEGRVAFLTNVLELHASPEAKTRGDLPIRFLQSKKSPKAFAEELVKEAGDLPSNSMFYISNRPKRGSCLDS